MKRRPELELSPEQLAALSGRKKATILRAIDSGALRPAFKYDAKTIRVPWSAYIDYQDRCLVRPTSTE